MYCESCGSFIEDGDAFCSECGAPAPALNAAAVSEPEPVPAPSPAPGPEGPSVTPLYEQPGYQQSGYRNPGYQQPYYPQGYSQPTYGQPTYGQPVYGQPVNVQPAYYTQPYGQPDYSAAYSDYQSQHRTSGLSIVSLVFGIIAACICWVPMYNFMAGVPAIVTGIIVLVRKMGGKNKAIAGLICAGVGILIGIIELVWIYTSD